MIDRHIHSTPRLCVRHLDIVNHRDISYKTMYSSTFIFFRGQYGDEFYRLDEAIASAAKSIPDYIGEETWENQSNGLISNVYYWESLESLRNLMNHPAHLEAKKKHERWLNGYQVIVSEVVRTYGDGKLPGLGFPQHSANLAFGTGASRRST